MASAVPTSSEPSWPTLDFAAVLSDVRVIAAIPKSGTEVQQSSGSGSSGGGDDDEIRSATPLPRAPETADDVTVRGDREHV